MRRPSRPAAGRARSLGLTLLLTLGAVPIALPLAWLVLSSLKTADRVLTDRPEWLPVTEEVRVHDESGTRAVTVVDASRAAELGWWRVRPAGAGGAAHFFWPAAGVERVEVQGWTARIGHVRRAVTAPVPAGEPGLVVVGQLGTQQSVAIEPGALREEEEVQQVLTLLGEEVAVAVEGLPAAGQPAGPDAAAPGALVDVRVVAPSLPFFLAEGRILGPPERPAVAVAALGGARLAVEVIERLPAAGVSRVRFVPGPAVRVAAEGLSVRRQVRVRYHLEHEGRTLEVAPLERDAAGRSVAVALPGVLRRWTVPAADVTAVTRAVHRVRWLGQALTVRPRPEVAAPAGLLALEAVGPEDAAVVAAERATRRHGLAPQWSNYVDVFRVEPLHKYVLNTLFITALSIVGNVLSCGLAGYAFARLQFRGRDLLFLVLLATLMLPGTITFLPTYILYVKLGWLDTYYPLVVPAFLATAAFFVFLYRQFFLTIPLDLEDAARIDGCGPLGAFWHILLPMARPAVVTVTVFTFLAAWNDFLGPLLYLNTDEYQTLAYGLYSFKTSFGYKFPHYMLAASTLMMIPTLVVFFAAQGAFLRGVVITGVKG